jgi:Cu-processing system permease protein
MHFYLFRRQFNASGTGFFQYGTVAFCRDQRTYPRIRATALWFFFVLVFDLLLLGALVSTSGHYGADIFAYLLLLNPTDVFRIINIFRWMISVLHMVSAALFRHCWQSPG